jgi:hypothetical protein
VNEQTLIRRANSDVPERDPEAKERARAMLRAEMGLDLAPVGRRRLGRPRFVWLAAAASVAVVLVLVQVLSPPHRVGPYSSAPADLELLADLSSSQGGLDLTGNRYLYTRVALLDRAGYTLINSVTFQLLIRQTVETWRRADGSGRRETKILHVRFASDADRRAWVAAGRPIALPKAGSVEAFSFHPGAFYPDLSTLPTDPDRLKALLESGRILGQSAGEANLALAIGDLFQQGGANPMLRASLFEILARLPSVRGLGPITDPLGREGVGFSIPEGNGGESWLVFDPDTASFLAQELVRPGDQAPTYWAALTQTAVVDGKKERPGGP